MERQTHSTLSAPVVTRTSAPPPPHWQTRAPRLGQGQLSFDCSSIILHELTVETQQDLPGDLQHGDTVTLQAVATGGTVRLTEKWLRGEKSPPLSRPARRSSASQTDSS
eukprot:2372169-Rhodomonas_salina.1